MMKVEIIDKYETNEAAFLVVAFSSKYHIGETIKTEYGEYTIKSWIPPTKPNNRMTLIADKKSYD